MRYSISFEVHCVVAGMGMTPSLIIPTNATYHSGILGNMRRTRSPFLRPSLLNIFTNRFEAVLMC